METLKKGFPLSLDLGRIEFCEARRRADVALFRDPFFLLLFTPSHNSSMALLQQKHPKGTSNPVENGSHVSLHPLPLRLLEMRPFFLRRHHRDLRRFFVLRLRFFFRTAHEYPSSLGMVSTLPHSILRVFPSSVTFQLRYSFVALSQRRPPREIRTRIAASGNPLCPIPSPTGHTEKRTGSVTRRQEFAFSPAPLP